MNLDSLSFALSQISYSVANLTKKNYKSTVAEISHLEAQHGAEAHRHLFRCLFSHVDFSGDGKSSGKDFHQTLYLLQECTTLLTKANFVSTLCYSIDNPLHHQKTLRPSAHLFSQISKVLKLNRVQEVAFGLAALSSVNSETRNFAAHFVKQKLPHLINSYINQDSSSPQEGSLPDVAIEVLHLILTHLNLPKEQFGVSLEQREAFFTKLQKDFPVEQVPLVLAPLLYQEPQQHSIEKLNPSIISLPQSMMEGSLAEMILEVGYGCTQSVEECRNTLMQFGVREINPASIARVLGMMGRTPSGLTDQIGVQSMNAPGGGIWNDGKEKPETGGPSSWNVDIFVQVVKDLAPHLNWREVVSSLDHQGFIILNKQGLRLLMQGLFRGLQDVFPMEALYQPWKNSEGQLSWLTQALKNPDVFCLADYPCHSVVIDLLKTPPDDDNRDIATWKSLDLVEALLRLSESGHYTQVSELFKFPIQHCPDMLLMDLLQVPTWNTLKHEVLSSLLPIFLGNHPNSASVLHYAWHYQGQSSVIRTLVMHAMAEWYMRGDPHDQTRLSRILDVAQDLKALSMLLNATPFAFVIDLSCLASRREYLKLDKWLSDKIREHQEPFLQACVNFLKQRCPQLLGGPVKEDQPNCQQLPPKTLDTMLTCLHACVGAGVGQDLTEVIMTMVSNASVVLKKARQAPPPSIASTNAPSSAVTTTAPISQPMPQTSAMNATQAPNPLPSISSSGLPGSSMPPSSTPNLGINSIAHNLGSIVPSSGPIGPNIGPVGGGSSIGGAPFGAPGTIGGGPIGAGGPIGGNIGGPLGGIGPIGGTSGAIGPNVGTIGGGISAGAVGSSGPPGPKAGPLGMPGLMQSLQNNPGIPNPAAVGMDPLSGMGQMLQGPTSSVMNSAFPVSLGATLGSSSNAPGSPAKNFNNLPGGPVSQAASGFNPMQGLTSQLSALNMNTTMSTGVSSSGTSRTPTLGGLNGNMKQQPPAPQQAGGSDMSSIFPAVNQQFSKEIEDEANSYFQRIYNHPPHPTISIDEVLEMLKRFKDSPMKKEREVFACMLRNLFEEYRFFPQYPDKELHTTAVLFGGIIEQGLVTYMDLGIALRYVLEALKKPHGSKMYFFGVAALDRFKTRLKDYPQYCQHLASIPHFSQFPQHLIEYVEYGARSQEPPNRPQGPVTTRSFTPVSAPNASAAAALPTAGTHTVTTTNTVPTPTPAAPAPISKPTVATFASKPSIANTTNIDTLLAGTEGSKEEIAVPSEAQQDKVFFIFNNLSLVNMEQKANELREYLTDEFLPWAAQYLVMKRASIEPNFHNLYAQFIDHLKKADMLGMVIRETYRNIKVLMRSDKGVNNFSDRSLLKNLGHWLGLLTLAKNKPILHDDIDMKSLIYEAYYKGADELLFIVPFVAKVLESCAKSKVFKPPNPWTMAIMNVLAELHQEPGLKLNLKFEIEVLCKALNLDITDLKPTLYLKDPERYNTLEFQLSPPKPKEQQSSTPQPEEPFGIAIQHAMGVPMPPPTQSMPPPVSTPTTSLQTTVLSTPTVVNSIPTTTTTTSSSATLPPQPQFSYSDINVMSLAGLTQHISCNDSLTLFQAHPQLKQYVRPSIERAVQELLPCVVERSIKIALTTCEQIVKKDFALDPEEPRMRAAAHHMVRNLTAGMALITSREPLLISISNNLKTVFLTALRGATQQQKESIEQAAQLLAQENTELACAFIQKTAVEKAIPEMDKRLATEIEYRKQARNEGRRYCDPVVLTYQAERMPEQIRLKVGGVTSQQISVYEEFARNIPGFLPTSNQDPAVLLAAKQAAAVNSLPMPAGQPPAYVTDEMSQIYDKIAREIESHLHTVGPPSNPLVQTLHSLMEAVIVARNSKEIQTAHALLQKVVEGLLDGLNAVPIDSDLMLRYRDCHLLVLKGLQDHRAYGSQWTNKQVTRSLVECREDYRFNLEAVESLIRAHLVNMQQYDLHLAQSMENGLNYMTVAFAMQLVQRFCLDDKHGTQISEADFYNTIETLSRIATHSRQAPEGLMALIETIRSRNDGSLLDRAPGGPTSMMHSGISQAREFDDPPGLHEKTEFLLRECVNMYHSPAAGRDSTKAFSAFVGQMHQQGILKTDDLITRFFRLCTEMCVDLCYRALAEQTHSPTLIRAKCFHTLDAFVRLIALLVKHSGDTANTVTKINLLNKVLGIVAGVLLQDHEVRQTEFQQLPYHRIFIMLFIELNAPEHVLESINYQVLTAFCNTFHILRPAKAPGFAYAWLELISHRVFIGRMLAITPQQRRVPLPNSSQNVQTSNKDKGWGMYAQLLIDLFKFLTPFLRNAELTKPTQLLYKGTLRVLLVLLHDFPEFLCDFHYAFCDVIPPNCIQMRNLILSAFPRNMRLPDPFTPNLKVDMLTEINMPPRIMTNFANMIQPASFKKDLESYLKSRAPVSVLSDLRINLYVSNEPGMRYNIPRINALVLYVGTQAISHIHSKNQTPSMSTIAHSSHMDIFQNLAVDLDTEGRYLFLNAIANQLRYPNSHTHYFSCTLLYLFAEANTEAIQEQITRVLLERLIVNRPHPWGLLITFIELIKNPQFKFWNHEFVHCAPEIEKLFESVARSCMQPRQAQTLREQEGVVQEVH